MIRDYRAYERAIQGRIRLTEAERQHPDQIALQRARDELHARVVAHRQERLANPDTPPICPDHETPMRRSQWGEWFCTKRLPDGTYCQWRDEL